MGSLFLLQGIFPLGNWTGVSCIAGGFFTNWAIREALSLPILGCKKTVLLFCLRCPLSFLRGPWWEPLYGEVHMWQSWGTPLANSPPVRSRGLIPAAHGEPNSDDSYVSEVHSRSFPRRAFRWDLSSTNSISATSGATWARPTHAQRVKSNHVLEELRVESSLSSYKALQGDVSEVLSS